MKRMVAIFIECEDNNDLAALQEYERDLVGSVQQLLDDDFALGGGVRVLPGFAYYNGQDMDTRPGRWTRAEDIGAPERLSERVMREVMSRGE